MDVHRAARADYTCGREVSKSGGNRTNRRLFKRFRSSRTQEARVGFSASRRLSERHMLHILPDRLRYLENMIAGGISRSTAQVVCHPLNVAKTLLQVCNRPAPSWPDSRSCDDFLTAPLVRLHFAGNRPGATWYRLRGQSRP